MTLQTTKQIGVRLEAGLVNCIDHASKNLAMTHSGFLRFCVMNTLKELSLMTEQVHKRGEANEPN